MPRYEPPDPDALSVEQQRVRDAIVAGPRGVLPGPLSMWLHRPELARHAERLGAYARYGTLLPPLLSELAILVTARHWQSEFEWSVHAPIALEAGISPALIDALKRGEEPAFDDPAQHLVYRFARDLHTTQRISDDIYSEAVARLGLSGVVDLVGILGYYTLISMTINVFEIPAP